MAQGALSRDDESRPHYAQTDPEIRHDPNSLPGMMIGVRSQRSEVRLGSEPRVPFNPRQPWERG